MQAKVKTTDPARSAAHVLALPLFQRETGGTRVPARIRELDRSLGGVIGPAIESGDFRARAGQTALLYPGRPGGAGRRAPVERILLVGLGKPEKAGAESLRGAAAQAVRRAGSGPAQRVSFVLPRVRRLTSEAGVQAATEGAVLGGYHFGAYRSTGDDPPGRLGALTIFVNEATGLAALRKAAATGLVLAESQNLARDLSNTPGNDLPPSKLASEAQRMARAVGLRSRVMTVPELERRKMGGILAVGAGSARPPRLIVLQHNTAGPAGGAGKRRRPTVCLVGKGITFDSGGISIKPSAGMDEMKHDMSGAAAVIGAMRAVALLDLPLHVVGVIAAAENLPSGTAYRPGDIVRAASGKTIEVLNTDAEGRIVLADALHYARTEYKPAAMIDLATLTGACMVALGPWASGLFGNDEALIERVRRAGDAAGERAWPMPLLDEHRVAVRSTVADVKNTAGREAGASTAAAFLDAFVGDTPWVHLDIAGTGWTSKTRPVQPRGGTGVCVRLLVELLRAWG